MLHTWGRTLNFHPHVHFVVPGGGIDKNTGIWRSSRENFYAPGPALAKVFMGSGCPIPHKELETLVRMAQGFEVEPIEYVPEPDEPFRCPRCGAIMVATAILGPRRQLVAVIQRRCPKRE